MEKIIKQILKTAMPWVKLKGGDAVDLYFEFVEPKEKREFFKDFKEGEEIKLPNFGKIEDKIISNPVISFSEKDLQNIISDEQFIRRLINQPIKKPLMDYDDRRHQFDKKEN